MPTLIVDRELEQRLQAERIASGTDRYDEVWEGVYIMAPMANNEHQKLATRLATCISNALGFDSADVYAGVNVSDRMDDWALNYRVPDVAVMLPGCAAQDRGTFIYGGPDFLAEIVSPDDRSYDKFDFYSKIGVRELLIVDRNPWTLELHQLREGKLVRAGRSLVGETGQLMSAVLPLHFRLVPADSMSRPWIEVTSSHSPGCSWRV